MSKNGRQDHATQNGQEHGPVHQAQDREHHDKNQLGQEKHHAGEVNPNEIRGHASKAEPLPEAPGITIYIDHKPYRTAGEEFSGAEIRTLSSPPIGADKILFRVVSGKGDDIPVNDSDKIAVNRRESTQGRHFFSDTIVPSKDAVARRAYFIYLEGGKRPGHDAENWAKAEAQVDPRAKKQHVIHFNRNTTPEETTMFDAHLPVLATYDAVHSSDDSSLNCVAECPAAPIQFGKLEARLERLATARSMRLRADVVRKSGILQHSCCGMISASPKMQRVFELIERFANNPSNILIEGETGTGKEQVARALHQRSSNARAPFVTVDCANVPHELAESELFGHEAGAFTGATRQRKGRVELAQGGTLFLDDVDDLPLELQGKLLRVIQDRRYERVGGERTLTADLRIISATKSDLRSLVKQGKFRDDLMYRLRVLDLPLAPLRERMEDVPMLAKHFLDTLAIQRRIAQKTLSFEALGQLMAQDWPGNVRELQHAMEYALAMNVDGEISPSDLPSNLGPEPQIQPPFKVMLDQFDRIDFKIMTEAFESSIIRWALNRAQGHQGKAADSLGIPRTTLQSKLKVAQGRDAYALTGNNAELPIAFHADSCRKE